MTVSHSTYELEISLYFKIYNHSHNLLGLFKNFERIDAKPQALKKPILTY